MSARGGGMQPKTVMEPQREEGDRGSDGAVQAAQQKQMIQQINLLYDLIHVEIEKIRRKAINQIVNNQPGQIVSFDNSTEG